MSDEFRGLYDERSVLSLRNVCVSVIITGTCLATFNLLQLVAEMRKSGASEKLESSEPIELVFDLYDEEPDEEDESVQLALAFAFLISTLHAIMGVSCLYMLKKCWRIEALYKNVILWRTLWFVYAIMQHILRCMISSHKFTQVQATILTVTTHAAWIMFVWNSIQMRDTIQNSSPMLPTTTPHLEPPILSVPTYAALKKAE